jgi:hypothetical protein
VIQFFLSIFIPLLKISYLFSVLSLPSLLCMKNGAIICCWLSPGQLSFVTAPSGLNESILAKLCGLFTWVLFCNERRGSSFKTGVAAYRGRERIEERREIGGRGGQK